MQRMGSACTQITNKRNSTSYCVCLRPCAICFRFHNTWTAIPNTPDPGPHSHPAQQHPWQCRFRRLGVASGPFLFARMLSLLSLTLILLPLSIPIPIPLRVRHHVRLQISGVERSVEGCERVELKSLSCYLLHVHTVLQQGGRLRIRARLHKRRYG